jgi:hypothetical protein
VQKKDETLRSYIQRWSVIKNSAEDVSDERAIDAFSAGLRRSDLVEEIGRTKPRTVSKLMEVANRFTDGEDTYNNKRGRSPEVDRASRQRRRYRNGDSHARRNQIAAEYERRDEECYENREFQARGNHKVEKPKYSGPSAEDMLYGPCRIHYVPRWEKSFQPPDEGLQNLPEIAKCHGLEPRNTTGKEKYESGIPSIATSKTCGVESIYICNDPTGAKIQERAKEHIQTSKPSYIITTSHYRVPAVVRSTS